MTRPILPVVALAALAAAGCKSVEVPKVPGVTPYRMVIQQGNAISQEMIEQLKPGMTKEQVRFVLGTPLVTDIFHADRWDYVYLREMPDGKREQRNLAVVFENNKLTRVIGDLMPPESAKPKASGFEPLVKPAPEAKPAAKPPAETAKPAADKPAPEPAPVATQQNWRAASDEAPAKPAAAAPEPPAKPAAEAAAQAPKPAAEGEKKEERGFFGRMLEKIGL